MNIRWAELRAEIEALRLQPQTPEVVRRFKEIQGEFEDMRWEPKPPKKKKMCAYCNVRPATDTEHVVARGFFRIKPNPPIKVEACVECNRGTGDGGPYELSQDEEYMQTLLAVSQNSQQHPTAQFLTEKSIRALGYPEATGLLQLFVNSSKPTTMLNEQGYLVEAGATAIDWHRIHRVIRKITRGLYAHYAGEPLPPEYDVVYIPTTDKGQFHSWDRQLGVADSVPAMLGTESVFLFKKTQDIRDPRMTSWLMLFYNWLGFLALTLPRAEIEKHLRPEDRQKYYMPLH